MPTRKKTNSKMKKQPIPEDFELSDDEPTTIKLDEEQKVSSRFIPFDCPNCFTKLQLQNEIEINPKGIKCRCSPCSFKISKNGKTMNVKKDDEGGITLDSGVHSISFSFNRITTPPNNDEQNRNQMISDVIGTPRKKKQITTGEMDLNF